MDAIIAVSLVDLSMQDCTLNDTVDALHSTFQKYPDFEYLLTAKKLLARLNLYEIWQQELLFYGKLLQIDHKTLESNIEKGDPSLFAKYDNIVNDTVPLTASLVTSSYFNINKKTNVEEVPTEIYKENVKDNVIGKVSDKLAATLKKHATLNKVERTVVQKKQTKRKRKEVTVDTSSVVKKKQKQLNKPKVLNENDIASESEDEFDTSKILHGVPSVNDFFTDLGINFKFNETPNQDDSTRESKYGDFIRHSTQNENVVSHTSKVTQKENIVSHSSKIKSPHKDKSSDSNESLNSSRLKRLKQFQFVEKHDLSKYEEKVQKPLTQNKIKVEKEAETHENGKSAGKLQLSIFESTVCEEILASQNKDESIGSSNSSDNLRAVRNSQVSLFENSDHEEANILQNKIISKLEMSRKNSSTNLKSMKSSQISIFESFDCDIDLDI